MKIYSIYFSPTGTSAKVAEAVACGIAEFIEGAAIENCDYTHRAGSIVAGDGDIAVIAAPVYGGQLAIYLLRPPAFRCIPARRLAAASRAHIC